MVVTAGGARSVDIPQVISEAWVIGGCRVSMPPHFQVKRVQQLTCKPAWRPLPLHELRESGVAMVGRMPWVAEH